MLKSTVPKTAINLKGRRFTRLTVLKFARTRRYAYWRCRCDCGKLLEVRSTHLIHGHTQSCGCLKVDTARKQQTTHGKCHSQVYEAWQTLQQRCNNPDNNLFYKYGARGITVGFASFEEFYAEVGDPPRRGMSIDRIDNNAGYNPSNIRWATPLQQSRNTRRNVWITYGGRTQILTDWAKEIGLSYDALAYRIKQGWPLEKALTETTEESRYTNSHNHLLTYNGKTQSIAQWARETGLTPGNVVLRLRRGWSIERALTEPPRITKRPEKRIR